MRKTIHFTVTGRVQGVFFRASTKQQADLHGVGGWVRNRADGRVEGVATAEESTLERFLEWLHRGPDMAKVLNVETRDQVLQEFDGFSVR